jgi:hypothetical protein
MKFQYIQEEEFLHSSRIENKNCCRSNSHQSDTQTNMDYVTETSLVYTWRTNKTKTTKKE